MTRGRARPLRESLEPLPLLGRPRLARPDLLITNYEGEPNRLRLGLQGIYEDATSRLGLGEGTYPLVGWGSAFGDLDLDGRLDLAVANGHVFDNHEAWSSSTTYRQPGLLHRRDTKTGRFVESAASLAPELHARASRPGLAQADHDNDATWTSSS